MKKQTRCVPKYNFFWKQTRLPWDPARWPLPKWQNPFFTGAIAVNSEPPASAQLVLPANSLMGRSYEACSSIKMPDLIMLWHDIGDELLHNCTAFLSPVRQPLLSWS